MSTQRYQKRGVSSEKEDVHKAIADSGKGLFPQAFCKIIPDTLTGEATHCMVVHADGAGTKSATAYLHYRENGDPLVFRGIAQDSLIMNIDDMLCVGASGPFLLSNTIGRNARLIPGEIIREIIQGYEEQIRLFASWGITIEMTGGETADVGDLVRTIIVDSTVTTRMARARVIPNSQIEPGNIIIGLASDGQTKWEKTWNSGIGSNGQTSARHDLLNHVYREKYPESHEPGIPDELCFSGPHLLGNPLKGTSLTIGEALLSPTRSYAPLIKPLLDEHFEMVRGLVHCTGGGQTKCLRAGKGIHYIKDNLFPTPPVFEEIRRTSGTDWKEMYQTFNMGHRMEIIGQPGLLPIVEELGQKLGLAVRQVGHCEAGREGKNRLTIHSPEGPCEYSLKE